MAQKRIIVGISGADGVVLGVELLKLLRDVPEVESLLVMTQAAERNLEMECGLRASEVRALAARSFDAGDLAAPISSGSFMTDGMIIAPCSMKTLAAIAHGYSENLLCRAADVCMKERRRLVLMPRETPLSQIHLQNMLTLAQAGCSIVPPMLTFYCRPQGIQDMVHHVLGKALMQFGIVPADFRAWAGAESETGGKV